MSIKCCNCAMQFTMPRGFYELRKADGKVWYCPAGHEQLFSESDLTVALRERDRLKQQLTYRDNELADQRRRREEAEKSAAAFRGHVTRLKNRVGVSS